jgi:multiple sugar transport system permease protein
LSETAYSTLSFFYSCGARAVAPDAAGNWRCVFNSPAAVEASHFIARLFLEPFENRHGRFEGVVNVGEQNPAIRYAMQFAYLDQETFQQLDPNIAGFGPVPKGPAGGRAGEFNAQMTGIYAGAGEDPRLREAAWDWIAFLGGRQARLIQAKAYVENGLGQFVQPRLLREAGYPELAAKVPPGWAEAALAAQESGVPEPYGRNCQMVYRYMSQAIDQIRTDAEVRRGIRAGDAAGAKRRIQQILDVRVGIANQKMLDILPAKVRAFRTRVAAAAALATFTAFLLVLRQVFKNFSQNLVRSAADRARGDWQFGRHKLAYLCLLPALLSIAVWSYWPLLRGTAMAFQDYNVRGFSHWVGFANFATVLFSPEFWFALRVSLLYTLLFMGFGFSAPILLALLLSEVPRGKLLFRTLYYLPAMLAGVVVIFLWKGFYGQHGMINQALNLGVHALNALAGTRLPEFTTEWLSSPTVALFFCVLPTIWAGMGPGCLIYLAALKGIPEDLYEAADLDGAGALQKAWHITLPTLKPLIAINFIGVAIGCMQSGSSFILAMTGGGPYTPHGATEVIGLHIFWEAFGYLRFGVATAMAWVLGAILIGFTVHRLQRLSKLEFKAAGGQ